MQRLARFTVEEINQNAIALFSHYDELRQIILRHLSPSTATLFARPEIKSDNQTVEWYSELEGQPYLLSNSEADKQQLNKLNPIIEQRISAIEQLNHSLASKGEITQEQSARLSQLVEGAKHNTKQIFVVNNEPVITGWGLGKKAVEAPAPVAPVASTTNKHRWCYFLLPLLLLLLLGSLLCWWFNRPEVETLPQANVEPPKIEEPQKVEEPKVEEPKVEEPKAEEPKEEEPKVEEPVKEEALPETVEEVKPAKVCRQNIIPGESPQMAIIFNNASAMRYTIKETAESIARFDKLRGYGGVTQKEVNYMRRKPNRANAAKGAMLELLKSIDSNIDIGLVELRGCLSKNDRKSAKSYGIFSGEQRAKLEKQIQSLKIRENNVPGIPIYEGLQRALKLVDGKEREALILFITDGNSDCTHRNECELLSREIQSRPKLKVNIVQINSPWNDTDCLAHISGGQIFNTLVSTEEQLKELIGEATKPMQVEEVCE
ncbi:hypothetical protein ACWIVU_00640 [Ursidibacter arcticus]